MTTYRNEVQTDPATGESRWVRVAVPDAAPKPAPVAVPDAAPPVAPPVDTDPT